MKLLHIPPPNSKPGQWSSLAYPAKETIEPAQGGGSDPAATADNEHITSHVSECKGNLEIISRLFRSGRHYEQGSEQKGKRNERIG